MAFHDVMKGPRHFSEPFHHLQRNFFFDHESKAQVVDPFCLQIVYIWDTGEETTTGEDVILCIIYVILLLFYWSCLIVVPVFSLQPRN